MIIKMKSFLKIFSILLSFIFVIDFYTALGQVVMMSNSKKNKKYGGDILLFGNGHGCPPGLIKDGGKKGTSVVAIPNCQPKKPKKPEKPKIEYVPYPVKEYVPIIKEKYIIVEKEKTPMHQDMSQLHMDMGMGYGLDSKKSVTHTTADKKSNDKQNKKISRNDGRNEQKSETRSQGREEKSPNRQRNQSKA